MPAALRAIGLTALAGLLGAGLAGLQLLPTAELAAASVRGAGLMSYRDAIAGSLWPWLVARALLPGYVNDLGSTEYLAYVGLAPLALALLALGAAPWRRLAPSLMLVGLGLLAGARRRQSALPSAVRRCAGLRLRFGSRLAGCCSTVLASARWPASAWTGCSGGRGWRLERQASLAPARHP